MGVLKPLLGALLAAVTLSACGLPGPSDVASAASVVLTDGTSADRYGAGTYGVLLIPAAGEDPSDWQPLAATIATNRMIVLVLESTDSAAVAAGRDWLLGEGQAERVAVIASGGEAVRLAAGFDQLIAISAELTPDAATALGVEPKLFLASEDHPATAADALRLADDAPGDWNLANLVPGSEIGVGILDGPGAEDLISAVIARLDERR